jgi:multiple sugar transport system substrate-binding protein
MKSLFKVLSLLFIAALMLAACGTPATVAPAAPAAPVKETQIVTVKETQIVEVPAQQTVVRLSGWASSPSETALLESLLYRFSVENPDITVKYEPITGDYKQALLTAIASGTEPDLYYMDIAWWQELAKNDVILPVDDLMSASGVKNEDFIPSLIDAFKFDGKTYGIPKDFNTLGLFFNKDLFDKAKLEYPTDAWTWDDLKNAAAKTTDLSDANKPIYGICMAPDPGRFPIFVFQNGGTVMNADFSDTTLDSDAAVGAAQYYTDFRANKTGASPADVGEGWQGTVFGKGQCAMVYEGGWLISYLRDQFPGTKYGVVIPPAGKAEGNLIFTVAWGISKASKNPEAAWKVVNFLTNEASQKTVLESGFALPTRISLQTSEYFKNNPNSAAIFNGALNNAQPFFWGSVGSDVNEQMGKALERVYKESQPVADAMKQAAEAIRKALKQ